MYIEKEKACSFTGHRQIKGELIYTVQSLVEYHVERLVEEGYTDFICGGALGFDTLAASTVINLRSKYKRIRLLLAIPHLGQEAHWSFQDRALYRDILRSADDSIVLSNRYTPTCMGVRNRYMIDNSNICIAYVTEDKGGAYNTVKYALTKDIKIINIASEL